MNNNPKVSVILPLYNNKEDIIESIKSVIDQTVDDWELLIVDDCSTDGSYEIVQAFIENNNFYPKIKLLKTEKNSGCYVCMNEGLLEAKGEYITRIDSDDKFDKTKIEKQMNYLDKNPEIVSVNCGFKRGNHRFSRGWVTFMYKKTVVDKMGYYDSVRFGADSEFQERMISVFGREKIHLLLEILYYAKLRKNSLTTSSSTGTNSRNGVTTRRSYVKNFNGWHKSTDSLYMKYPLKERPFAVDFIMLP